MKDSKNLTATGIRSLAINDFLVAGISAEFKWE